MENVFFLYFKEREFFQKQESQSIQQQFIDFITSTKGNNNFIQFLSMKSGIIEKKVFNLRHKTYLTQYI